MSAAFAHLRRVALVTVLACQGDDHARDLDHDGVLDFDDCAPQDPDRFPGNPEVCDGADNDCDREVDDGLVDTWFVDVDGDGHGDPDTARDTCRPSPGMVRVGDDCNDVVSSMHPGAVERCDDLDNDCRNGIDDARWSTDFSDGWDRGVVALTGDSDVTTDPEDASNRVLRLVRGQASLQGGLWLLDRVPAERWRLRFRLRVARVGGTAGEGLAFAFIRTDAVPVIGAGAENLGIYGADVDGWALEFDVARNGAADSESTSSHLAFQQVRDALLLTEQPSPRRFDDGFWHDVEYLQDGDAFLVKIDGFRTWEGTLALELGSSVTMGFTAATSRDRQMQFAIDDVELACPDTPAATPPTDSGAP